MPAPCPLFVALDDRITALTAKFLGAQLADEVANPLTFSVDLDGLAAFRLLAHAEIEDFLELKAKENLASISSAVALPTCNIWSQKDIYICSSVLGRTLTMRRPFDRAHFLLEVQALLKEARDVIADNNGIKEDSFFLLAALAGKPIDEFQPLTANLTSYGKNRGDVAHRSVTRVATILAPSAEAKQAREIVDGLKQFFYGP